VKSNGGDGYSAREVWMNATLSSTFSADIHTHPREEQKENEREIERAYIMTDKAAVLSTFFTLRLSSRLS
jgi:hypothetical protein